jgi:small-conductance mechanosensitive channel
MNLDSFRLALLNSVSEISRQLLVFLPLLLGAIIILALGFLLGKWFKTIVQKTLELAQLTALTKHTAIAKFLNQADTKQKIEGLIGEIVRWLTIAVFFIAAINVVGLVTVSEFLSSILRYIPRVISATLVLAAGALIGGWVEGLIKGAVSVGQKATGRLLGKIAGYTVIVFAILAAISELGIAQQFINTLFIGFVAMLALGLGLAFGLGAKDVVGQMITDWYRRLKRDLK